MKPSSGTVPNSRTSGDSRIAVIAAGVSTWLQKTLKLGRFSAAACLITTAVGGVVVSKPIAKNTTSRSGCSRAMRSASALEYTIRTSPPRAFACSSDRPPLAGTRIVSAYVHRTRPGRCDSSMALSIRPIGSTHTGQPGPWIIRIAGGSRSARP